MGLRNGDCGLRSRRKFSVFSGEFTWRNRTGCSGGWICGTLGRMADGGRRIWRKAGLGRRLLELQVLALEGVALGGEFFDGFLEVVGAGLGAAGEEAFFAVAVEGFAAMAAAAGVAVGELAGGGFDLVVEDFDLVAEGGEAFLALFGGLLAGGLGVGLGGGGLLLLRGLPGGGDLGVGLGGEALGGGGVVGEGVAAGAAFLDAVGDEEDAFLDGEEGDGAAEGEAVEAVAGGDGKAFGDVEGVADVGGGFGRRGRRGDDGDLGFFASCDRDAEDQHEEFLHGWLGWRAAAGACQPGRRAGGAGGVLANWERVRRGKRKGLRKVQGPRSNGEWRMENGEWRMDPAVAGLRAGVDRCGA